MAHMDGNGRAIFFLCTLAVLRLAIHAANSVVARIRLSQNLSIQTPDGRRVELETPIINGQGRIDLLGKTWTITGDDAPAGTTVRVTDVDGETLRVVAVTGMRPVRDVGSAPARNAGRSPPTQHHDTLTTGAAGLITSRFGSLGPLYRAGGWAAVLSLVVMASASIFMIAAALFRILSDMPVLEMTVASAVLAGYLVVLAVAIKKCIWVKPAAEI
jgi:membrane protein implicated in regulation of membrane protease activity